MNIELNIDPIAFLQGLADFWFQDPVVLVWGIFKNGGWVVLLLAITYGLYIMWLSGRQKQFADKWQYNLLAIDIPKNNEQSPKAVENIFVALAGAQSGGNLLDRFWYGKVQESFSFEIVSLEGYIQFLVRTPSHFRDLIEAAIYAQYPEAEITEVDDYAEHYKDVTFPHEKYNLWGTEFVLVKDYPYPIKTYPEFEHTLSASFMDPMAGILEILSRIGPGEQSWIQLIVTPQPPGWGEKAEKVVKGILGEKFESKESLSVKAISVPLGLLSSVGDVVTKSLAPNLEGKELAKKDDKKSEKNMTPGLRNVLTNIERKLSKHAFRVKFRMIYFGEKESFNKGRGVAAIVGAIQQFNLADSNGFKPGSRSKTGADYFQVKKRLAKKQNHIFKYYRERDNYSGDDVYNMMLNTEELASLWHFPVITVKAPSVEKITSRKVVPPTRLPIERAIDRPLIKENIPVVNPTVSQSPTEEQIPTPPSNLPTV